MTQPPEVIKEWIIMVNDEGFDLTSWEESFMESITDQFDRTQSLSDKQEEILERIYANKTP